MSLNQSFISDFSEYYRWSQRTKIKYELHYINFLIPFGASLMKNMLKNVIIYKYLMSMIADILILGVIVF